MALRLSKDIRSRLGKLPKDLKITYDEIFNEMTEGEIEIVDRALRWIMCLRAPLSTSALLPAVCQDGDETLKPVEDLDEEALLHCCRNLLVIDSKRNVWVPAHLSVIEYVESHRWNQHEANCFVGTVCLALLLDPRYGSQIDMEEEYESSDDEEEQSVDNRDELMDTQDESMYEDNDEPMDALSDDQSESESLHNQNELPEEESDNQNFDGLREYARFHWMLHVRSCEGGNTEQLSTLLKRFLGSPNKSSIAYQCWFNSLDKRKDHLTWPETSLLAWGSSIYYSQLHLDSTAHAICAFGFYTTLSDWWQNSWGDVEDGGRRGHSLLQFSAIAESISICNRLLEWKTDINEQVADYHWGSALVAAVELSSIEIVKLFIENGADVNMQVYHPGNWGSALAAAASVGSLEKIELLIKSGAMVNMPLERGSVDNALVAAVWQGEEDAVKLLLKAGADVNMQFQTGYWGSALEAALGNGKITKLLIEHGAAVNIQLQHGRHGSALAAAAKGSQRSIQQLIGFGAEVNMQLENGDCGSALATAALNGNEKGVKLLIESGADVNMELQNGKYGSALAAGAVAKKHQTQVVELLIESGAVNMQSQHGEYSARK